MPLAKTPGNSIELVCDGCGTLFRKLNIDYNAAVKKGQTKFYHSSQCKPPEIYREAANKRFENKVMFVYFNCAFCGKQGKLLKGIYMGKARKNQENIFCNKYCSSKYTAQLKKR